MSLPFAPVCPRLAIARFGFWLMLDNEWPIIGNIRRAAHRAWLQVVVALKWLHFLTAFVAPENLFFQDFFGFCVRR
jgi:hypothetical protein